MVAELFGSVGPASFLCIGCRLVAEICYSSGVCQMALCNHSSFRIFAYSFGTQLRLVAGGVGRVDCIGSVVGVRVAIISIPYGCRL